MKFIKWVFDSCNICLVTPGNIKWARRAFWLSDQMLCHCSRENCLKRNLKSLANGSSVVLFSSSTVIDARASARSLPASPQCDGGQTTSLQLIMKLLVASSCPAAWTSERKWSSYCQSLSNPTWSTPVQGLKRTPDCENLSSEYTRWAQWCPCRT